MFWAACPRSNRIDSGASAVAGSGVTRAIADGGAGEVAGPRADRRQLGRWARSRQTMNVQRCWFLLLPECRPASRIRSRWAGSSGRSAKRRTARLVAIAVPDRVASTARSRRQRVAAACGERRRLRLAATAADAWRPGSATWASVRRPPGSSSTAANWTSPIGDALGLRRGRDLARGRPGRAGRRGRPPGTTRPRVDSPGPRTATSAAPPATTSVSTGAGVRLVDACRAGGRRRGARSGSSARPRPRRRGPAGPGPS